MDGDGVARSPGRRRAELVGRFATPVRRRGFWPALWAAAAVAELAVLVPLLRGPADPLEVVFPVIGGSFAACGLIAWRRRPDSRSGLLMTATGVAFLLPALFRAHPGLLAQTVQAWFADLWTLFFVPLVLTYRTGGRLRTSVERLLVAAVAVEILVLAPLWLAVAPEPRTLLLVAPDPAAAAVVDTVQRALYLAVSAGTATVVAVRWRAASRPGRRAMLPSVGGAVCLLLYAGLLAVDLVVGAPRAAPLLWLTACSIALVPLAFLTGLLRSRLARGELAGLFAGMATMQPVALQAALARVLHDPAFAIAYPGPDGTVVDADGRPTRLPDGGGGDSAVTVVEWDGAPVAALVYDRSLDDDPELVEAVGGAATIALENRLLQAQADARLAELQASRQRLVTAADAERRRIERNLHDGAQQRLVTLALQLSLIQRRIRDGGDAEALVATASDELAQSLAELRELARGIHPAALDQGLESALEALVLRAPVPVRLAVDPGPRLPPPVEFAAYFVASEALTNVAKYARASAVTVTVVRSAAAAVVEIADDGVGGADPAAGSGLRGLADRVEALGGRFRVSGAAGGGTVVTAELPCPS